MSTWNQGSTDYILVVKGQCLRSLGFKECVRGWLGVGGRKGHGEGKGVGVGTDMYVDCTFWWMHISLRAF